MLFEDLYNESEDGDIGDGSAGALRSTFADIGAGIDVASKAVSLFSGNKSASTTLGGVPVQQPIVNQGGKIEEQNQTASVFSQIPVWGWIAGGVVFLFGLGALALGRR